jgi:hypothetical protein
MIRSLIRSPIRRGIRNAILGDFVFTFSVPFVSEDGFVLTDDDGNVLLASGLSARSAFAPSQPLISEDGFVLLDDNNNLLLGA